VISTRKAALGALLLALTACRSSGFSAPLSINPVMLGPIPSLGGKPAQPGTNKQGFESNSWGQTELIVGDPDDGYVQAGNDGSYLNQGDIDVLVATNGDPTRPVGVNRVGCGGYDFNFMFLWSIDRAWCNTTGNIEVGAQPDTYDDRDPVALTDFHAALDPNGKWLDDPTYGTVWVPSAVTSADFTPYTTGGHWVHDDDWVWVSDYDWGWAPFHYGRWVFIEGTGWAWVPGRQYRGAWVAWQLDDDGAYVGWAPLGPEFVWKAGAPVVFEGSYAPRFAYVGRDDVFSASVNTRVVAPETAASFSARMHPYGADRAGVHSGGPPPDRLGYTPDRVPHATPEDQAKLARARDFSRPSTATQLGAHPATRTASNRAQGGQAAAHRSTTPAHSRGGGGGRSGGGGGAVSKGSGGGKKK